MIKTQNKALKIGCSLILAVMMVVMWVMPIITTYALDNNNNYDNTSINEDLATLDLSKYVYNKEGEIKFITLAEYCFSADSLGFENYGLYLYIYNPARIEISDRQGANTVEIATKYDKDGIPIDYENMPLKLCGISTGDKNKLIYKYKVMDSTGKVLQNARMLNNGNGYRRYDISGVQLWEVGKINAVDYGVGGTYKFTGFAKGYGADENAESSLLCSVKELETIKLDVRSTNYRTASSALGKDHQNQLDSVYFSIDNEVLQKYGKLQKVKAEWYEYKTAPIVVTQDKSMFDVLSGYVGIDNGEYTDGLPYKLGYNRNVISSQYSTIINYDWSYNVHCYSNIGLSTFVVDSKDKCNLLPYLFYTGGTNVKDYTLSSDNLKQWIYSYDKNAVTGYLPIKNGNISADLFLETVDANRKKGYNCVEIDSSEKYDLLSYTSNHGFWDKVGDYGFWATVFGKVPTDNNVFGIEPIYAVKDKDLSYDTGSIANSLLISPSDVSAFKDYYKAAKAKNKTTFLFRFAVTDYFSGLLSAEKTGQEMLIKDKSYMAKETVFMDFDIIQLTFNKDGKYTVIPVVSNPIDIVGAITPPIEFEGNDWWKIVLGIILLVLLLILLFSVLPWIIKGIVWVVRLPFRLIGGLFKGIGKKAKKPKKVKEKKGSVKEITTIDDNLFLDDMDLWEEME